jgi:hypothetical protein
MRRVAIIIPSLAWLLAAGLAPAPAQDPAKRPVSGLDIVEAVKATAKMVTDLEKQDGEKKFRDFAEVIKGAEKTEGLFTLYRKDEHLYAEIKTQQMDQPFLAPIAIARGMASAGNPLNFGDEWVLSFRRAGDKIQVLRRNVHYKAPDNTPLSKAVKQNFVDSIVMALPIVTIDPNGQAPLIDLAEIFLTDFAELGMGSLDRNRTTWHKIKAFPNNLELEVEATFTGFGRSGMFFMPSDNGVADNRGITLVLHYSLVKPPESGYKPRMADDRVGHFLSANKDFGLDDPETSFVRQVNRWRLEKVHPKAKLSAPKKQLIWWIEDTVPQEYRPYVQQGILEWNKAFEKIGYQDAIAVRWQGDGLGDAFDPEDVNYCTFRWITTDMTFAMSGLRANPLTGEMIDGDVIFDSSWIKVWKQEYAFLTGTPMPTGRGAPGASPIPLAVGEIISPMMAVRQGFGSLWPQPPTGQAQGSNARTEPRELVPAQWGPEMVQLRRRLQNGRFASCQYSAGLRSEFSLAALAMAATAGDDEDEDDDDKDKKDKDKKDKDKKDGKEKDKEKKDEGPKLPDEFLAQAIKEVVMHEVGHSLGLRHNFRGSAMLSPDQINDPAITRVKGLSGSVMDYNPINIAPRGKKQGDYASTTIGPYDYWAIEYAYKEVSGDEPEELKKIAARAADPDLTYGTDEDFRNDDPLVNVYDLGNDPIRYARDRIELASALMQDLDAKVVKDGESWARVRYAFSTLLSQWGNAAYLASSHIGGQYVTRDHKGDKGARDPIIPVPGAKQREALAFLADNVLGDKAFKFSPKLLRKLTTERWYHWGESSYFFMMQGVDYPVHERVLAFQKIVLDQCLSPSILARLQNQEIQADPESRPLKMAEVFRSLTDGIFADPPADGAEGRIALSTIRRNLQLEYLSRLSTLVLGEKRSNYGFYSYVFFFGNTTAPADARSLARMHLREIADRIVKVLNGKDGKIDDTTRAHLEESRQRIAKVLDANLDVNEP